MDLKNIIDAILFAKGKCLTSKEVLEILEASELADQISRSEVEQAFKQLQEEWQARAGGFSLEEVAGGYEFRTRPEYASWISLLQESKPQRLSLPAIESLAVIAYRQPITRAELEALRGVDCAGVLKSLGDRNLLRVIGRKEEAGRPLLYGTTKEFLELFGLSNLDDLPPLKEFEEKIRQRESEVAPLSVADLASTPQDLMELESGDRAALEELEVTLIDLKEVEKSYQEAAPQETQPPDNLEKTETIS